MVLADDFIKEGEGIFSLDLYSCADCLPKSQRVLIFFAILPDNLTVPIRFQKRIFDTEIYFFLIRLLLKLNKFQRIIPAATNDLRADYKLCLSHEMTSSMGLSQSFTPGYKKEIKMNNLLFIIIMFSFIAPYNAWAHSIQSDIANSKQNCNSQKYPNCYDGCVPQCWESQGCFCIYND